MGAQHCSTNQHHSHQNGHLERVNKGEVYTTLDVLSNTIVGLVRDYFGHPTKPLKADDGDWQPVFGSDGTTYGNIAKVLYTDDQVLVPVPLMTHNGATATWPALMFFTLQDVRRHFARFLRDLVRDDQRVHEYTEWKKQHWLGSSWCTWHGAVGILQQHWQFQGRRMITANGH